MNLIGTKEGSALIFMREINGVFKTLKYDFRDSSFYVSTRKDNWRKVKSAGLFFNGISPSQVIESFEDSSYKEFLRVVLKGVKSSARWGYENRIQNVSTLLQYIPQFLHIESWVLSGINFKMPEVHRNRVNYYGRKEPDSFNGIKDPVNIFQKDVLSFMKAIGVMREETDTRFSTNFDDDWVVNYKANEDLFVKLTRFVQEEYKNDLEVYKWVYELLDEYYNKREVFIELTDRYNMEYKSLFNYLVKVDRTEALGFFTALVELRDYINMNTQMRNNRASKYPDNLTLRHNITARNYRSFDTSIYELQNFTDAVDSKLDWMNDNYAIVTPMNPDEMKVEGNKLHHCVATYITKVINRTCQIVFLRDLKDANEPLVTVEVANGKIGMVSQRDNRPPTEQQVEVLKEFAEAKRLFYKDYDPTEDIKLDIEKAKKKEQKNEQENNRTNRPVGKRPDNYTYQTV